MTTTWFAYGQASMRGNSFKLLYAPVMQAVRMAAKVLSCLLMDSIVPLVTLYFKQSPVIVLGYPYD